MDLNSEHVEIYGLPEEAIFKISAAAKWLKHTVWSNEKTYLYAS